MRRIIIAIALIALATPAFAQLCPDIPVTDGGGVIERDVRLAVYKVMHDVLVELPTTDCHDQRLQLAQSIASSPGEWWRVVAEYRQAQQTNCQVAWSGLSWATLTTQLSGAWSEVAELRYGS